MNFADFMVLLRSGSGTVGQSTHQGNGRHVLHWMPSGSVPGSISAISQKCWAGLSHHSQGRT